MFFTSEEIKGYKATCPRIASGEIEQSGVLVVKHLWMDTLVEYVQ